jgi:hypothetical protein
VVIADPTIDYIVITDSPDGNELEIVNIAIGGHITAYASGYNSTGPTYVGLVEVDWTDTPDLGTFDNDTGTNTVFTAGLNGGSTNITGQNTTHLVSDNFTVVIANLTIDYIIITDSPDGNELEIVNIAIGGQVTAYASGYNNTGPTFVGLVEVDWTDVPDLGTFDNDTGTNTVFTAGLVSGSTTITGQNDTLAVTDTFYVDITNATVDYIQIRDGPGGGEVEPGWWNENWSYRKKLTFDNSGQSEALVNFSVLVVLNSSNFDYSKVKSDGTDLRFIDTDNVAELKYHIEDWDTSGNSYIWVNVPHIAANSDTDYIWMYYGNPNATDVQDESATYDENYVMVQHLNETSGTHYDSTGYNNDGSPGGGVTQDATGQIDGADYFDGIDDYVEVSDSASLDITSEITIEAWVYFEGPGAKDYNSVVSKRKTNDGYSLQIYNDRRVLFFINGINSAEKYIVSDALVKDNEWSYIVAKYDGSNLYLFIDGVEKSETTDQTSIVANNEPLRIGTDRTGRYFNGTIDEVRISNIARSADWIMAQYLSMNNSFITSGDAAGRGGSVVTNLTLDIGQSITLWAAAYNYTLGYLGDYASTTWSESSGGSVITVTTPGASTTVQAQLIGGQSTITADYGGIQNTTSVTVNPPTIDFIIITNTPDGTALDTVVLDIGRNVTAYASGYNVTTGYVDLVEVVWTDVPDLGTFDNDTGTNMIFTAGFTGGSTNITGQNTTLLVSDNFTVVINDPTIDFIIITDSPDGNELEIVNIDIEGQVTAYASGYNNTGPTYVGLVEVDWTDLPDLGTFDNDTGTNTVFTAGQETGLTTITGQNTTLLVSDNFTVTIANLTVDYIIITDSPDGNELEIVNINIGRQVTVYASGYNNTGPTYVGLVEVDWTDLPNLGTFDNDTGTNAVFTAGYTGGSTNITGQNTTLIVSDNFTVVIADPTIDYIIITDSPDGNELGVVNIDIGGQVTAYASGYNNTGPTYVGLVEVDWTDDPDLGTFDNDTGTNTIFTAGFTGGFTNITGQNTTMVVSDNFTVNIAELTVDYIIITDAPDGNELEIVNIFIGGQVTAYASGYNNTGSTYVGLVEVEWTDIPDLGTFDNETGTNTVFTAGSTGGSTNITGQNTTLVVSDNFTVVITELTLDYIIITDSPDGNELEIVNIGIGEQVRAYASGYNNTGPTYIGLVEVDWTDLPDLGTFDNETGTNTIFTAGFTGGSTNITGQNTTLIISDNFTVVIADPTIDYVIITDSPNGNELEIVNIDIGGQVTAYASGYNTTSGYVDLVEVDWTDVPDLGTFDNDTGTNTVFTAGYTGGSTNITGQNTTLVVSDNFTVVIADPTIDYIIITDSPDGNELEVVNIGIGGQVTAFASGFNNTGPTYVGLVEVDWTDTPDLGTFDNDTGTNTVFTAGSIGGSTNITGQNTTLIVSDNFTVIIADPTVDYIIITDAPDGNELEVVNIAIGGQVTAFASGYNNTGSTYVGLVEVDWTDIPDLGTFDNNTGTNTVFTAGLTGGSTNITGQNTTLVVSDNFTVIIAGPTIDYILITDAPDGNELEIVNIDISGQVTAYASGYNTTSGYVDLVEVDWTDNPDLGTFDNDTGTNTVFTAGVTSGTTNIIGQNTTLVVSDNFFVVIADPTIDYIIITDAPNGNELEIVNIDVGGQVTAHMRLVTIIPARLTLVY